LGVTDELVVADPSQLPATPDPAVEAVFGFRVPKAAFLSWPHLRWVQSTGAGVDFLDPAVLPPGVVVSRVPTGFAEDIAEYVLGYLLAWEKRLFVWRAQQREHLWRRALPGQLAGRLIGVAGAGAIGLHLAKVLQTMGCRVRLLARHRPSLEGAENYSQDETEPFLEGLEVLVLTLPLTVHTHHFLDRPRLARLARGAGVINVGRGELVDLAVLKAALDEGAVGWAVLDVFPQEPWPPDDDLWARDNVFITPHVAGPSRLEPICQFLYDNWRRFRAGSPLLGQVDLRRGY